MEIKKVELTEDEHDLFLEWTTLYAMVMKIQQVPLINNDLIDTANHIVDAFHRYNTERKKCDGENPDTESQEDL